MSLILQPPLDGAIAALPALAARQHAVFAVDQLTGIGLSGRAVQHRVQRGRLHRVYRSVYSLVPLNLLTREGWWMAAVLAAGSGAVLSHRKAATLHGLLSCHRANIEVIAPGRARRVHRGMDVRRSTTLAGEDSAGGARGDAQKSAFPVSRPHAARAASTPTLPHAAPAAPTSDAASNRPGCNHL